LNLILHKKEKIYWLTGGLKQENNLKESEEKTLHDPSHSNKSFGFLIPQDADIRFSKLLEISQSVSVDFFKHALQILGLDLFLIRNQSGDTLFHAAVQLGDIKLLNKLYNIGIRTAKYAYIND
jgi:hypothetical protein